MRITWKKVLIECFKGIEKLEVAFNDGVTMICGQNASGKTTILDAITWLLFNKDSHGREKFNIRMLDENGEKIHYNEIVVYGECEVDGKPYTFKKTQKENWVKARGSENQELKGNVNVCEINGFPKSDSEYRAEISEIVDEGMFKLLTNPTWFASIAWKEQREILMKFVGDMSDAELAHTIGGFDDLMSDLEYAKNTDDIQKKYARQIKELKEKANEIPVRIDEIEKTRVYIDVESLENKRIGLESQLKDIEDQLRTRSVDTSSLDKELSEVKKQIADLEEKLTDELRKQRISRKDKVDELNKALRDLKYEKSHSMDEAIYANRKLETNEVELKKVKELYTNAKQSEFPEEEWQFDERSTICKMCGRALPEEKIAEIKDDFEKRRADAVAEFEKVRQDNIKKYAEQGKKLVAENEDLGKTINEAEEKIAEFDEKIKNAEDELESAMESVNGLPDSPDFMSNDEWNELNDKKVEIEEKTAKKVLGEGDTSELEVKRDVLKNEIEEVNKDIASEKRNEDIDSRVAELDEEMKDVQQKIAYAERMVYLLEKFVKAKMETVSDVINDKFQMCKFKLFETQLNGGVKECCEMTVNGVPYSVLNSGHRIVGGLDVIKALQTLLGAKVPIWIDNAETVNSYNLPDMGDTQMVLLKVTDAERLEVC